MRSIFLLLLSCVGFNVSGALPSRPRVSALEVASEKSVKRHRVAKSLGEVMRESKVPGKHKRHSVRPKLHATTVARKSHRHSVGRLAKILARAAEARAAAGSSSSAAKQVAAMKHGKKKHKSVLHGKHRRQTQAQAPLVFIGVISAPGNAARRQEVRQSWMQHELLRDPTFAEVRFVVGVSNSSDTEAFIEEEMRNHGDLVRLAIPDSYEALSNKTLAFFEWFVKERTSKYAMKLDDDTFPRLDLLQSALKERTSRYVYLGRQLKGGPVLRTGRWREDPAIYADKFYPTYMAGSGYVMSRTLAEPLVAAHQDRSIKLLTNEDAMVGVWVQKFAKSVSVVDFFGIDAEVWGCTNGKVLSMNLKPGELSCMWEKRQKNITNDMCCRPLRCYGLYKPPPGARPSAPCPSGAPVQDKLS